jgi:hypothetical protein
MTRKAPTRHSGLNWYAALKPFLAERRGRPLGSVKWNDDLLQIMAEVIAELYPDKPKQDYPALIKERFPEYALFATFTDSKKRPNSLSDPAFGRRLRMRIGRPLHSPQERAAIIKAFKVMFRLRERFPAPSKVGN